MQKLFLGVVLFSGATSFAQTAGLDAQTHAKVKALVAECLVADTSKVSCVNGDVTTYGWKIDPACKDQLWVSGFWGNGEGADLEMGQITIDGQKVKLMVTTGQDDDYNSYSVRIGDTATEGKHECLMDALDVLSVAFAK